MSLIIPSMIHRWIILTGCRRNASSTFWPFLFSSWTTDQHSLIRHRYNINMKDDDDSTEYSPPEPECPLPNQSSPFWNPNLRPRTFNYSLHTSLPPFPFPSPLCTIIVYGCTLRPELSFFSVTCLPFSLLFLSSLNSTRVTFLRPPRPTGNEALLGYPHHPSTTHDG